MKLNIEIVETPDALSQGLMFRETLDKDNGMLFKFPSVTYASFWGKNTYLPLDLAFISSDGTTVIDVNEITPMSTKIVHSTFPCKYVLEVNSGYFKDNGIQVGTRLKISEEEKRVFFE